VSIEYKHSGNKTYVYISNPNPFVTYSVPWASVKKDATRQVTSSASRIEIAVLQDSHKPSLTGTYFLKAVYKDSDCPVMEREISTQVGTMQGSVGISSSGGDSFTHHVTGSTFGMSTERWFRKAEPMQSKLRTWVRGLASAECIAMTCATATNIGVSVKTTLWLPRKGGVSPRQLAL
jgi:hypothetical protein